VINRSEENFTRSTTNQINKVFQNVDPAIHPFERAREYKRALNTVKLDRVYAKPFLGALTGHLDGVYTLAKHHKQNNTLFSGSCDGEVKLWNVAARKSLVSWYAHSGFVRGITVSWDSQRLYTCGSDTKIQCYNLPQITSFLDDEKKDTNPTQTLIFKYPFNGIDHQRKSNLFGTTSAQYICIWDPSRSDPITQLEFGYDSVGCVKFNPIDTHIIVSASEDRSVSLYDLRSSTAIRKTILQMRTNDISWNPMEAFNFTVANEDHNAYSFDMRKLDYAKNIHKDHVSAVLTVDYSPTGQEFSTGSYDRTVRIFERDAGHSREVYHTKRMQRIFTVKFSNDANYVYSGSEDGNIRIWKAVASENMGILLPREKEKQDYQLRLVERYKNLPEIRKIYRKRHVPKAIKKTQDIKNVMKRSQNRKDDNVRKHSKPGSVPYVPERKKNIVREEE
jgi:WD repeat and SOF domain-containing protein 1